MPPSVAKHTDRTAKKFMRHINAAQDQAQPGDQAVKWTTLVTTMGAWLHKTARKLTQDELENVVKGAINLVTGNRADELVPADALTTGLSFATVMQDEIFRTRCWGVCGGSKKTAA